MSQGKCSGSSQKPLQDAARDAARWTRQGSCEETLTDSIPKASPSPLKAGVEEALFGAAFVTGSEVSPLLQHQLREC